MFATEDAKPTNSTARRTTGRAHSLVRAEHVETLRRVAQAGSRKVAPRARFELATLRLTEKE